MKLFYCLFSMSLVSLFSCKSGLPPLEEAVGPGIRLTTEKQLSDIEYCSGIGEFYDSGFEGSFTGRNEVPIRYRIFRQNGTDKGAILISSGRTESMVKYQELIYDLFMNGYSVYILDHRGQGLSGRMAADPEMGYVDSFQFYVDDMKSFFDLYLGGGNHSKKYLMAHSMGGAIGVRYLEQYPGDFDAAAFSSPMLGLKFPICPLARLIAGKMPKYGPGQGGYKEDSTTFEGNAITGSKVRYLHMIHAYDRFPEARLGGATTQWVDRSCRQFRDIFKNAGEIRTPLILFSAEKEKIVDPGAHSRFMHKVRQSGLECQAFEVGEALHELFMEKDGPRSDVLITTLGFFDRH
jgi:lysophospholipase